MVTTKNLADKIKADFDRLALLEEDKWNHNNQYHAYLLKHIAISGVTGENALEIGCGTGTFSRLLAPHFNNVLGLDLSPEMIRLATEYSSGYPQINYQNVDVLEWDMGVEKYDCIASIATIHHLPTQEIIEKMRRALKVNGILIVLDLVRDEYYKEMLQSAGAIPLNIILKLVKIGRLSDPPEVRLAWKEHGRTDNYLTMTEVRQVCADLLPGALIKKHLFWRYSVVWQKIK